MCVEVWLKEEKSQMMMELLRLQELNLNWKTVDRWLKEQQGYM